MVNTFGNNPAMWPKGYGWDNLGTEEFIPPAGSERSTGGTIPVSSGSDWFSQQGDSGGF